MSNDKSIWARRPEVMLVWIVWAFGPGFWGANLLLGLFTRADDGGPPDLGVFASFMFCHLVAALGTLGLLFARGPQWRLPEFWILVAYWIPFVGFICRVGSSESHEQRLVEFFVRVAVVLIAAMPAAAVVRVLWRWSATIWRTSANRDGPGPRC